MSSKYSNQLIDSIASWTNEDNLDASAEELLDFFADLSATEAADIIAAYTVIDRAGEMNYTGKLPQSAAWLASDGYCNEELFSREKQYAIGKRLLVHSNQYVREIGIQAILDGAFSAPEDELVQLIVDALFDHEGGWDFWYVLLNRTHTPGQGVPARVHLRLLPHLMRVLQLEKQLKPRTPEPDSSK